MNNFKERYSKLELWIVHYICGILILFSMLYVTANVVGRYCFNLPIPLMTEIVGVLLAPIVFLSLSYGWEKKGTFVAAEFLLSKMSGRLFLGFRLLIELLGLLLFTAVLGYAALLETVYKYKTGDVLGPLGQYFPSWPFQASIVVGFILLAIRIILNIIKYLKESPT